VRLLPPTGWLRPVTGEGGDVFNEGTISIDAQTLIFGNKVLWLPTRT
jgi:hypothetical protein